jgi:hypothetical protein
MLFQKNGAGFEFPLKPPAPFATPFSRLSDPIFAPYQAINSTNSE